MKVTRVFRRRLLALVVVALMSYTTVSLRSASAYQTKTVRVQAASDAVDLAVAEIRKDRSQGTPANPTVTVRYDDASATCTAEPGSGRWVRRPDGALHRELLHQGTAVDPGAVRGPHR